MKRRIAALFLALLLLSAAAQAAPSGVILGILEDAPNVFDGHGAFFKVRLAFMRQGNRWAGVCTKAFCPAASQPDPSRETAWNIGFSGRYLGSIAPPARGGQTDWTLEARDVPTVGKPSPEFGGFPGVAVHRPLIVSSRRRFADPDGWKAARPSARTVSALRTAFRERFPEVENCDHVTDEEPRRWLYKDANIRIKKFYASRAGWSAAVLALSPYRCEGPVDDAFDRQVFAVSPQGKIQYLDQGLWLVDAGDYDGDGKSELVFAIDRYNEGGYTLYYDDFTRHATAEFHYH